MADKPKLLTEAQLLKMPEDDYMNPQQLAFFKNILETQRDELLEQIESNRKEISQSSEAEIDPSDVATQQEMLQMQVRLSERHTKLLAKIEKSLRRIASGEYGYCVDSGEPIGLRRLLARPTAVLSIQSKENQEHQERTEGVSGIGGIGGGVSDNGEE